MMIFRHERTAPVVFLLMVFGLSTGILAQTTAASKDSLRILFDSHGGFKPYHLDGTDGSYQPLLNPAAENPVSFDIYRNGSLLPLQVVEGTVPAKEDDPGYRGPAYTADDIAVQTWGLDVSASSPQWSAIRYEITNTGKNITTLSLRFIFDTWLGESGREPLTVLNTGDATTSAITDETLIKSDNQLRLIASLKPDGSDSLYLLIPNKSWSNVVPKRLVIANIRRLQNSTTNYEVEEHRAFNLLPFSINDSALALFYDSEVILPNQRIALDFLLSSRPTADAGQLQALRDALAAIPISKVTSTVSVSSDNPSKVSGGRAELVQRINSMLATLTILMASESYKQVEIERLVQAIDTAQKQLSAEP